MIDDHDALVRPICGKGRNLGDNAWRTGSGVSTLHYGLWPFVLGDVAKIFAAAAIIDPAAPWGR